MAVWSISSPFDENTVRKLRAGDSVSISGSIYTARDVAHKRLVETIKSGRQLPFDLIGQTLYYMGPSPARPGRVIGACGPTTSGRMDLFTPTLLAAGIRAMIGKGERSVEVKQAIKKHRAVYFVTYGGAGALLAQAVCRAEVVAYPELDAEAIMRLEVEDLPGIVADDIRGGDLFEKEIVKYAQRK
jgi:fumarate hydratase subunit beta